MSPATTAAPDDLWRVHTSAWGPLNPPLRSGMPSAAWSRFDQPGRVTLYGGGDPTTAFLETLSYAVPTPVSLAALFDDHAEPVADQWDRLGFMHYGHVPAQWRLDRELTCFRPITPVPVVDLGADDTIAFLRATVGSWWPPRQARPLSIDLSLLTGGHRRITSRVAWWLARQVMPDGTRPAGLAYPSRHGANRTCYALWIDLSAFAPGTTVTAAVATRFTADPPQAIPADHPALVSAARQLGLTVF